MLIEMSFLPTLVVVGLGYGVEYCCWSIVVATILQRAREGVDLDSSTMTVTCRFGLSVYHNLFNLS